MGLDFEKIQAIANAIVHLGDEGYQQLEAYIKEVAPKVIVDRTCPRDVSFTNDHVINGYIFHLHTEKAQIYMESRQFHYNNMIANNVVIIGPANREGNYFANELQKHLVRLFR